MIFINCKCLNKFENWKFNFLINNARNFRKFSFFSENVNLSPEQWLPTSWTVFYFPFTVPPSSSSPEYSLSCPYFSDPWTQSIMSLFLYPLITFVRVPPSFSPKNLLNVLSSISPENLMFPLNNCYHVPPSPS